MPGRCVAAYCSNSSSATISLFKFPKDEKIRKQWVQKVRRTRGPVLGSGQKEWTPTPYSQLCSAHFAKDCFDSTPLLKQSLGIKVKNTRILLPDAVPDIFPREPAAAPPAETTKRAAIKRRESTAAAKRCRLEIIKELLQSTAQQDTGPTSTHDSEKAAFNRTQFAPKDTVPYRVCDSQQYTLSRTGDSQQDGFSSTYACDSLKAEPSWTHVPQKTRPNWVCDSQQDGSNRTGDSQQDGISSTCDSQEAGFSGTFDSHKAESISSCDLLKAEPSWTHASQEIGPNMVCDSQQDGFSITCDSQQDGFSGICNSQESSFSTILRDSQQSKSSTTHDSHKAGPSSTCDSPQDGPSTTHDSQNAGPSSTHGPQQQNTYSITCDPQLSLKALHTYCKPAKLSCENARSLKQIQEFCRGYDVTAQWEVYSGSDNPLRELKTLDNCVPVKVDYVGPGRGISDTNHHPNAAANSSPTFQPTTALEISQDSNDAANPSLTLQPGLADAQNGEAVFVLLPVTASQEGDLQDTTFVLASSNMEETPLNCNTSQNTFMRLDREDKCKDLQLPERKRCRKQVLEPRKEDPVFPEGSEKDTDVREELEMDFDYYGDTVSSIESLPEAGTIVKKENELETDLGIWDNTLTSSQVSLNDIKEEEMDQYNWNTTTASSQLSCSTLGVVVKQEYEPETDQYDLDNIIPSLEFSCETVITDVKEEEGPEILNDCDNTSSQLSCGTTVGINVKQEDEVEKNLGTCDISSSQPNCGTLASDVEEDEPEDDFEDSEEDFSSSEDEKKGHKSDSSWHMSSDEEEQEGSSDESASDWEESERRYEALERQRRLKSKRMKRKNKKWWFCNCGEKFEHPSLLKNHKLEAHPVACEHCEEKFPSKLSLRKHLKTHNPGEDKVDLKGNVMVLCDLCGQFFRKGKLKQHKVTHSKTRPYKCEWENCKAAFKHKGGLGNHVRSVHERRFPCSWKGCEKVFGNNKHLRKHYLVHTGERSLQCSYCGKMFQRSDHLQVHMRIHTGDMPFQCSLCNYGGRQSNCLRWHMKTHHPEHCKTKPGDNHKAKGTKTKKRAKKKDTLVENAHPNTSGSDEDTVTYSTRSRLHKTK